MTKDQNGVVTFEYGTVATAVVGLVLGVPTTTKVGTPDAGSFTTSGLITIAVSKDKVGNPEPGDLLGAFSVRTYANVDTRIRSTNAIDTTTNADANDPTANAATYALVGSASCQGPGGGGNCIEDTDPQVQFDNGWHLISDPDASAGHFRLNTGKDDRPHAASLTFSVPTGMIGKITYDYAKSPKGGTAQVILDGVPQSGISYSGPNGSTRDPEFRCADCSRTYTVGGGSHTLEIGHISGAVYVDRFCLENASPTSQPTSGPGPTSSNVDTLGAGQELTRSLSVQAGALEISVMAEPGIPAPIQLVLIDPSGSVLETADASSGFAVIERPVTQSGTYVIKVVNLSLGPVQVWSVATPLVSTQLVAQVSNGMTTGQRAGTPQGGPLASLLSNVLLEVCERVLTFHA
jgi:hypothetical protein